MPRRVAPLLMSPVIVSDGNRADQRFSEPGQLGPARRDECSTGTSFINCQWTEPISNALLPCERQVAQWNPDSASSSIWQSRARGLSSVRSPAMAVGANVGPPTG